MANITKGRLSVLVVVVDSEVVLSLLRPITPLMFNGALTMTLAFELIDEGTVLIAVNESLLFK